MDTDKRAGRVVPLVQHKEGVFFQNTEKINGRNVVTNRLELHYPGDGGPAGKQALRKNI